MRLITTSTISKDHKDQSLPCIPSAHQVRIESHALCYFDKDRSQAQITLATNGKLVLNYPINIKTDKDLSQAQITLATNGKLVLNYPINIKTDKDRSQAQIST